jgi:hypothetical protein
VKLIVHHHLIPSLKMLEDSSSCLHVEIYDSITRELFLSFYALDL